MLNTKGDNFTMDIASVISFFLYGPDIYVCYAIKRNRSVGEIISFQFLLFPL